MKAKNLFINLLAVLISLPLIGTVAQAATIEVLETFDFPGTGNQTLPQKINETRRRRWRFPRFERGVPGFCPVQRWQL